MKVSTGIPDASRAEAVALYWQAFGEKLGFVLGPKYKAVQFIGVVMRSDHGICAHDAQGRLLGVAGFKTENGALVGGTFPDMRRVYGWTSAALRGLLIAALERDVENKRFLMDGLFVAADARGKGVGTALLQELYAEARRRGYTQVRLDVVDTNKRARALYEQEGFEAIGTRKLGILRYIFRFNAATTMVRDV
ncbi:GNAT family N-acetyltransferase [Yoonia sediminilitoris]|uniref:Acetyltransferase (GNAT) family protein n=1 Tax=Yoonia sediminilitoris TaxID=1286148 RepID=A0A2T6KIJ7_9RHOB|nr:GNAT family N-acetyltransferase [Yoonia sediminilitoris]PUB15481.1 acetyltransferase (GNAT) family protein [Yoonia sediminilitoris]RCW96091.1 acetyltransferase (GNAT) family protein [Yoonia sediminilitoris]